MGRIVDSPASLMDAIAIDKRVEVALVSLVDDLRDVLRRHTDKLCHAFQREVGRVDFIAVVDQIYDSPFDILLLVVGEPAALVFFHVGRLPSLSLRFLSFESFLIRFPSQSFLCLSS